MKKFFKSKTFVGALLSIALCVSLIAGATFAIFTSEASVNIAVTSGTVKVMATVSDFAATSPEKITSEGVVVDDKYVAGFTNGGEATQNGNEITLKNVTPGDKVTFKITVKNESTVKIQYRTKVTASEDNGLFGALKIKIGEYEGMGISEWKALEVNSKEEILDCVIELPTTATNEYQNKQCKIAFTVEAIQGNAETANDTAYYTLEQFNALTEIPEGIKNVYVYVNKLSVTGYGKCATIGNYSISDQYAWVSDGAEVPEEYVATTRRNAQDNATAYRTEKEGVTLHVLGSLTTENYNNGNFSGFQTLCFQLPEKSTVILENMILDGSCNISGSYTYKYNTPNGDIGAASDGYTNVWYGYPFVIDTIKLSGCTINGQWFANGNVAKNVEIDNCTFNDYKNDTPNWGNPIWWKNAPATNLTITGCMITSTRPMKVGEGGIGSVTVIGNTFTMLAGDLYTGDSSDRVKNTALCFGNSIKGDVKISGNTVNADATALISLLDANTKMPEGKTFTVSGNTLSGVPTFVKWKDSAEFTPEF